MKKNIIFLSLLCCVISLRAMDTTESSHVVSKTFDESSDEELLQNKTASSKSNEKPVIVRLNCDLSITPKKRKKHSNATKIAELEKRLALLEKLVGIKN